MSIRLILAATAAVAVAGPALAQDAPAATPPAAQTPAPAPAGPVVRSPEETAFEAKAEAFEGRMEAMGGEMQTAITAAAGDQAKLSTDLDAIAARYQPEADTFAGEFEAFLASRSASMSEAERTQMTQMTPVVVGQIKGAPASIKGQALQTVAQASAPAAASPPAPATAPATPATPQ